jgi:flagellar basal body-associated protein FliL
MSRYNRYSSYGTRSSDGFSFHKKPSLVEIMIVVAMIGILGVVGSAMFGGNGCGLMGSSEAAKAEARRHAQELGWDVQGIACTGIDSDGDGYIACTVVLQDGSERNLECASGGITWTSGCKRAPVIMGE